MNENEQSHDPMRIEIEPTRALVDEEVDVRLTGFPAEEAVVLRASMEDDLGRLWSSEATFRTDEAGTADVRSDAPDVGTYTGADPMGLIWSMNLPSDEPNLALFPKTGLDPSTVTFSALLDGVEVAVQTLERQYVRADVVRRPVHANGLRGAFFAPPGPGPHPAVIVIGGSGGGLQEDHAALFASRGFAALALAYFAFEHLPKYLIDIPLEYFETAIQWMVDQPVVDGRRLALVGKSRGAEVALQLGAMFPNVSAVIAYVPSHVIWGGIGDTRRAGALHAWTHQGQGLPYVPNRLTQEQAAEIFSQPRIPLTPMFLINLEDAHAARRAEIPVERIRGPVLLVSGNDDQMWPSTMMADRVLQRLKAHRHPYPDRHLAYEDAGHMILTSYQPTTRSFSQHPVTGQVYAFGGTPEGYAVANRDSWAQVLAFLVETFE